jgi:hypothetical protein
MQQPDAGASGLLQAVQWRRVQVQTTVLSYHDDGGTRCGQADGESQC